MTTNTGFVITDAGNAAATIATPSGPYIFITQFKVTDSYNWTPNGTETSLPGTVKFAGGITNYYVVDYNTIELILFMDATVGNFNFGTIGIFLSDGTLFASCAFDTLQEKIKAIGNQAGTQWRIRARLKLDRASVVCQVSVVTSLQQLEVANWNLLVTPANQPGNSNMAILTGEKNTAGESILVYKDTANSWGIVDYGLIFTGTTASGGTIGTTNVSHPNLANVSFELPQTNSRYLIKFPDGDIRRVTSIGGSTSLNFTPAKAVSQTGTFTVWEDNKASVNKTRWADRFEYNRFVTAFNPYWSAPTGTFAGSNNGANQTAIPALASPNHPTYADFVALHQKVTAMCKLHGVVFNDIVDMDYAYTQSNVNGWGLQYIKECWDILAGKIALLSTNRNTFDVAYQESIASVSATRAQPWGGAITTKTQTVTFTYANANTFKALVNNGHQISIAASVAAGANANWSDMKAFLAAMGTINVGIGDTTVTGSGGTLSGLGLYELTGSYQQLYTRTATITGGTFTVTINGRITGGNVVDLQCIYFNAGSGYYSSGVNDLFTSAISMRRPSSTLLLDPILAYPTVTQVHDF